MPHSPSLLRARLYGAISLLLVASFSYSSGAMAYERATVADEGEVYLFWPQRTLRYVINEAGSNEVGPQDTIGAIQRAFFSWASPSCTDLYFIYDGLSSAKQTNLTRPLGSDPDGQNMVIWRESWPPAGAEEGSLTADMVSVTRLTFIASTGEIVDGDIDLNGHDHYWSATDQAGSVNVDIESVLAHEIGHLIGLDFSQNADAVMYGDIREGDIAGRELHQDDVEGVCHIYPFGKATPDQTEAPPAVVGSGGGCCATAGGAGHATSSGVLALLLLLAWQAHRRAAKRR